MPAKTTSETPAPSAQVALADRIDNALPQTQCTRCGYPDCRAYAHAIAHDGAPINRCPPGGAEGIQRLARITGRALLPLDPECGSEAPRAMAVIDETWCIGCTLCLDVCPTDAILGISKRMHTVIEPHCTGCELCLPVCPVDCIALEVATQGRSGWEAWSQIQADQARSRYVIHSFQRTSRKASNIESLETPDSDPAAERKRTTVQAALARARGAAQSKRPKP